MSQIIIETLLLLGGYDILFSEPYRPLFFSHPFLNHTDDSCFLKVIYDTKDIQDFQTDLNHIQEYCNQKKFKINTEKSVHLRIKFKNHDLIGYQMNGQTIEMKTSHKHLGFILDNKLTNNENVEHIYNNSLKKWHYLRKLFPFAKSDILINLFKTYIPGQPLRN